MRHSDRLYSLSIVLLSTLAPAVQASHKPWENTTLHLEDDRPPTAAASPQAPSVDDDEPELDGFDRGRATAQGFSDSPAIWPRATARTVLQGPTVSELPRGPHG